MPNQEFEKKLLENLKRVEQDRDLQAKHLPAFHLRPRPLLSDGMMRIVFWVPFSYLLVLIIAALIHIATGANFLACYMILLVINLIRILSRKPRQRARHYD
jgi:hypothetical protein